MFSLKIQSSQGTAIKENITPFRNVSGFKVYENIILEFKEESHFDMSVYDNTHYAWVGIDTTSTIDYPTTYESKVTLFLEKYPILNDELSEIKNAISLYFDSYQKILYDIFQDPESGEEQLLIEIVSDYNPDEALDRLESFDRKWWIQNSVKFNSLVVIDIGYE